MDSAEQRALEYLEGLGIGAVRYEPDGNIPPDFLVAGQIAVEVRRLNQNVRTAAGTRGLDEDGIPLLAKFRRLLTDFGPPENHISWWVYYRFRRPLAPWKAIKAGVSEVLTRYHQGSLQGRTDEEVVPGFELIVFPAHSPRPTEFVLAGYSDHDSGGWLLELMKDNLQFCIAEKARKIAHVRSKYAEWWLILVDYVGYGLDDFDRDMFREKVRVEHDWDRIVLLDPLGTKTPFEL